MFRRLSEWRSERATTALSTLNNTVVAVQHVILDNDYNNYQMNFPKTWMAISDFVEKVVGMEEGESDYSV